MATHPLLQQAKKAHPIIENDTVTFVCQSRTMPLLLGDFNYFSPDNAQAMEQVDRNLWARTLTFPTDTYMEYAFMRGTRRMRDPFNKRTSPNGFGEDNYFFYMPDAAATSLSRRRPTIPHGTIRTFTVPTERFTVRGRVGINLYQPLTKDPCPLLVVYDGNDYWRRGSLINIVDNLIADKRIRPIALALVDNAGRDTYRFVEYACSEATLGLVLRVVLPLAQQQLKLIDPRKQPGAHGIMGASMGGLMSLYTALRVPDIFGNVLAQGGAYSIDGHDMHVFEMVEHMPVPSVKIWMDCGRYDFLLPGNERMYADLKERGYPVTYRGYNGGHNYPAWRDDVAYGLETLFG